MADSIMPISIEIKPRMLTIEVEDLAQTTGRVDGDPADPTEARGF